MKSRMKVQFLLYKFFLKEGMQSAITLQINSIHYCYVLSSITKVVNQSINQQAFACFPG